MPEGYERKFENFIKMCKKAKSSGVDHVIIAWPSVLGDNYNEVIESLSRLAEANLRLIITGRQET